MTKYKPVLAIIVSCMLIAFAGSAKSGVVQCIDPEGTTIFTDLPCLSGTTAVAAPLKKPLTVALLTSQTAKPASKEKLRPTPVQEKQFGGKSFALDAATMSAAKASMVSLDMASDLARQEALAGKALQAGSWAFWRS